MKNRKTYTPEMKLKVGQQVNQSENKKKAAHEIAKDMGVHPATVLSWAKLTKTKKTPVTTVSNPELNRLIVIDGIRFSVRKGEIHIQTH